jgi:hypothetical protein
MDTVGVSESSPLAVSVADSLVDVAVVVGADMDVVALVSEAGVSSADGAVVVADVSAASVAVVVGADVVAVVAVVVGAAVVPGAVVIGACEAVVTSSSLGSAGTTVVTGGATVVVGACTVACVWTSVSTSAGAGAWVCGAGA